jgi:hypothetical protein
VPPATELVVLFAPPPQQRRSRQLTARPRPPEFIPNVPWSSPPPDPANDKARRPIEAVFPRDRSAVWLRNAAIGLCTLAAAAAAVSFTAQYRMIYADRRLAVVAGLEAAIPDAAALVFACLGVALALHGRRAIRARALNVASVGASVFMNVIAASPGWRNLAVWAMPPVAYALASDTLIGVVRSWVIARHKHPTVMLADGEVTPLAVLGGLVLWLLRLALAPASTLAGFRAWVLDECPIAPGCRAARPEPSGRRAGHPVPVAAATPPPAITHPQRGRGRRRGDTKSARFLALVTEHHGPLAAIPLDQAAKIAATLAPQVDLNTGAARTVLRRAVLAAQIQNGTPS